MAAASDLLTSGTTSEKTLGGHAFIQGAQNVSVYGGNFHTGNIIYQLSGSQEDILTALKHVPNYRDVHSANLGRATEGTGPQFAEWVEYCEWSKAEGGIRAMWGTGMPGAGKTIFSAIVINKVEAYAEASSLPICVGYIYFRYSDHTKATTRDCLEVLVKQTIERHPECLEICSRAYAQHIREKTRPSEGELMQLLRQFTQMMLATFYFLDAVDEAPPQVQHDLLSKLSTLDVRLFITSRPMDTLQSRFPDAHCYSIRAQDRDLDLHIKEVISKSVDLQSLLHAAGPGLYQKVATTVKVKCDGMFLHASLQLDALRDCTSIHGIETVLDEFPPRIEDVYRQTWQRIQAQSPENAEIAKSTLIWVLCAERSLQIDELRYFVAACPKTHKIERRRLVEPRTLMALCRGLISLEKETQIVRFVHYSAKSIIKILTSRPESLLHSLPAYVCLALLEDYGLQESLCTIESREDLERILNEKSILRYAYDSWSFHAKRALGACGVTERVAGFIQSCHSFPVLLETDPPRRRRWVNHCEPAHMVAYFDLPLSLAGDYLDHANVLSPSTDPYSPLMMTVLRRLYAATQRLLALPLIDVNRTEIYHETALHFALRMQDLDLVKILLAHPKVDVNMESFRGRGPPLRMVINMNPCNKGLLQAILAHCKTEVNARDSKDHKTALMLACNNGDFPWDQHDPEIVSLLLQHPGIRVNLVDVRGKSALILACTKDHKDAVKHLLAHPHIDVNLADEEGKSAVDYASSDDIRQLLTAHPRFRKKGSSFSLKNLRRRMDTRKLSQY